ncbi:MAG: DUF7619 domain-containing protein, partial [Fluviicola sp.]
MKKIITFIAIAFLGSFQHADAQTTSYSFNGDTLIGCQNNLYFNITIGALPETGGVISVDWGDGNTSTENYSTSFGNTTYYGGLLHSYTNPGSYTVSANVYSGTAGANVDAGQTVVINAVSPSSCGYMFIYTYQSSPNYQYENVPYQFTDVNNNVTTITPVFVGVGGGLPTYNGLNPANAPYTVQVDPAWLALNGLTQTSSNITINSFDAGGYANSSTQNMAVSCSTSGTNPDFGINFGVASNFLAPLQTGNLTMNICNFACSNTANVSVSVQIPATFVPVTSGLTNPVLTGNVLTFDINGLSECQYLEIPFTFPGSTPAGTGFCFDITLTNANDTYLANNQLEICGMILNSYDPNEKIVDQPTIIDPTTVQEFQYIVHFQNDGNLNASTVVIKDTIAANLDLSTFKFVASKHGVSTSINETTREVTFTFNTINLGQSSVDLDASQGYVVYTISEMPNLPLGSVIENTAYIYFDFNPAIVTNTTYNINQEPLGLEDSKLEAIYMYPN